MLELLCYGLQVALGRTTCILPVISAAVMMLVMNTLVLLQKYSICNVLHTYCRGRMHF